MRCKAGHFYDADKNASCPHCKAKTEDGIGVTVPLSDLAAKETDKIVEPKNLNLSAEQKTIGYFDSYTKHEPVVGWLVCIEGESAGEDYRLKTSKNYIGRAETNDVIIRDDNSISREKHAIIIYEPIEGIFIAQPGESSALYYCNDKVVLSPIQLKNRDVIRIGKTKLVFVPFCIESFKWENSTKEKQ